MSLIRSIIGTRQQRRLARYERRVAAIGKLEPGLNALSDDALRQRAADLRQRAQTGTKRDALLVEAFALGREASRRTLGMRHYDVQLMGGIALHEGLIVEMKTGEGKTLAATLPAILNALGGDGVHVVTVNDYLAERDARWMEPLYELLGLRTGVILEQMGQSQEEELAARQAAYGADITYGTNHEIAFDYLRDNLAQVPEEVVHRGFSYAIIDEVDFLIIDEARTPLIISGPSREDEGIFDRVERVTCSLRTGYHYVVEPKTRSASLTDLGIEAAQDGLGIGALVEPENLNLFHAVHQSILAHGVYARDVDYIVDEGRVFIVDEFTGRVSEDKRFADGLHQALEAKERVTVRDEDRTLAKVTYQTFFGRYAKLSGMTGTARSEREEFSKTYGRDVQVIPTHEPMVRTDFEDEVFDALADKHAAIADEITELHRAGRPVLVGSTSVRESEQISRRLREAGVSHQVLNAKNHHAEAAVIAQAGRKGAVTISTNMAGRGTDIILGGDGDAEEPDAREADQRAVADAGGLHVIGTSHHEAARIDDQLRGRAGRQGDPGSSQFMVCLDDELWQKFGRLEIDDLRADLEQAGHPPGRPITSPSVLRLLLQLQKKVDEENRAIRRDVLKYDLVIHAQRESIYGWRRTLVTGEGFDPEDLVRQAAEDLAFEAEDDLQLAAAMQACFSSPVSFGAAERGDLAFSAAERAAELLAAREERLGAEIVREIGRQILLGSIDELWTDHLSALERLEEGIGLRGYAQVDPVVEWRREATEMWDQLHVMIRRRAVKLWFVVEFQEEDQDAPPPVEGERQRHRTRRSG
jgi:preprotein translocase subunit SecA